MNRSAFDFRLFLRMIPLWEINLTVSNLIVMLGASALNAIKYLFHREEIPAALLQGIYAYTLDRLSPKGKPGERGTRIHEI